MITRVANLSKALSLALLVAAAATPATGHATKWENLVITHPWVRATDGGEVSTVGYLVVQNKGTAPDRLLAASVDVAGSSTIQQNATRDGSSEARAVTTGIEVAARGKLQFREGGYLVVFSDLKRPLAEGEMVTGSLTFERAGTVSFKWSVGPSGKPFHQHAQR